MEEYKLNLPYSLYDCPLFWKRFINTCVDNKTPVQEELDEIGCRFDPPVIHMGRYEEVCCVFPSEEAFIYFKLRWS